MATLDLRAQGTARAATAWERYADPARWSSWAPQIQRGTSLRLRGPLPVLVGYAPVARLALGRLVAA